jgi:hypothetical protein
MKWLIAIPFGVANGLVWAFLLACLFIGRNCGWLSGQ